MNGKIKKAANFLFCTNALTQRNVTSIGLVMIFFLVYVLAGGKVTTDLPAVSAARGLAENPYANPNDAKRSVLDEIANPREQDVIPDLSEDESKEVLGVVSSDDRAARAKARAKVGSLFTEEERKELENQPIDKKGLVKGAEFTNRREQWKLEQSEQRPVDSLSVIEERLRIKKR